MPKRIHKRWLEVTFLKTPSGEEGIQYRSAALPTDQVHPPPYARAVRLQQLNRGCREIQSTVQALIDAAREGRPRGGIDLETPIASTAELVLPPAGFSTLMNPEEGIHPWVDITQSDVAELPWEAFPESFRHCRNRRCQQYGKPIAVNDDAPGAGLCGCGLTLHTVERKLAFGWHLAHVVHSSESTLPPDGRDFLLVVDPSEDLLTAKSDPTHVGKAHLAEMIRLLEGAGYKVRIMRGREATDTNFLEAIKNSSLAGLYYYGHGHLDEKKQGCLVLRDRQLVFDSDIERVRPRCQFVFLNACHGAATGESLGFGKPSKGVAQAFAAGGASKVVIAPIWPVINSQAATFAIEFFRRATRGCRLSKALRLNRRRSYRRYVGNTVKGDLPQPDFCWAAYRYFGDPDQTLPKTIETPPPTSVAIDRVFSDGRLAVDVFSLPIDDVLLRAAKRRNLQQRKKVTCTDILAGLIRCGELTRSILRREDIDPDQLYYQLLDTPERAREEPDDATMTRNALSEMDRWVVRDESEFDTGILEILCRADTKAQQGEGKRAISELDVLEVYFDSRCWGDNPYVALPSAKVMRELIKDPSWCSRIDENGRVVLLDLDGDAKGIVDQAHALAQLRGVCPIPSRLMLAAFLIDEDSYASALCATQEVRVESLCALLLAICGEDAPEAFEMGEYACSRIVTPMVEQARRLAADSKAVKDSELFRSFCMVAPDALKELLLALPEPWRLDLDTLFDDPKLKADDEAPEILPPGITLDWSPPEPEPPEPIAFSSDHFTEEAWRLVLVAADWARLQRSPYLRGPHLFAALVGDGTGPLGTMLRRGKLDPEVAKIHVLMMIPVFPDAEDSGRVSIGRNAGQTLLHAIRLARKRARQKANVEDIAEAFLANGGGAVGEQLRQLGVDTRPWWFGRGLGGAQDGNGRSGSRF